MRFFKNASVVASVVASSGCLTLYGGTRQPVIVNASPAGAQVFLQGQPVGTAPVEVAVDRGSEPVFRVESDGFEPAVVRPRRRVNGWIAVDLVVGALAFYATGGALLGGREGSLSSPLTLLAALVGAAPTLVDFNSGAAYSFPHRVHAVLRPAAGHAVLRPAAGHVSMLHLKPTVFEMSSRSATSPPWSMLAAASARIHHHENHHNRRHLHGLTGLCDHVRQGPQAGSGSVYAAGGRGLR